MYNWISGWMAPSSAQRGAKRTMDWHVENHDKAEFASRSAKADGKGTWRREYKFCTHILAFFFLSIYLLSFIFSLKSNCFTITSEHDLYWNHFLSVDVLKSTKYFSHYCHTRAASLLSQLWVPTSPSRCMLFFIFNTKIALMHGRLSGETSHTHTHDKR